MSYGNEYEGDIRLDALTGSWRGLARLRVSLRWYCTECREAVPEALLVPYGGAVRCGECLSRFVEDEQIAEMLAQNPGLDNKEGEQT